MSEGRQQHRNNDGNLLFQYLFVDDVQTVSVYQVSAPLACDEDDNTTIKSITGFAYLAVIKQLGTGTFFMHLR
jgi:hypothetical protein